MTEDENRVWESLPQGGAIGIYHMLSRSALADDREGNLQKASEKGMIARDQLKDGVEYVGHCRNSSIATWRADKGYFEYEREKFGSSYMDTIEHPADDRGFDIFVPVEENIEGKLNVRSEED